MFPRPRKWRNEPTSWLILLYLSERGRLDRRQIREQMEDGQPHGLLKALVTSRGIKRATEDLLLAGLIKQVQGIPLCFADYILTPPAFDLTDKGRACHASGVELPRF